MNEPHPSIFLLEERLQQLGIKRSVFLTDNNVSSQTYNNWRKRGIAHSKIAKIAESVGLTYYELLGGDKKTNFINEPEPPQTQGLRTQTDGERIMLEKYRSLSPNQQAHFQAIGDTFKKSN